MHNVHSREERTRRIITLNYNHLPCEIKSCMIYLSIFPRGYVINKDRLVCRWIAEGLIEENRQVGMTKQEVAECYFDELLCRNMIEPITIGYDGRVELCKVHDMVLEIVVSKALETYFVALLGGQHRNIWHNRIRRLSIHEDDGDDSLSPAVDLNMQRVRSLSIFQRQGHDLLDQLDKFTLLRVLDLEGCSGVTDKHVRSACQLHLLNFLSLRGTDVKNVPRKIKKLEHLQTFDVRDTLLDDQLPDTITNLQTLERLLISNRKNRRLCMWRLPQGLQKMKALREVRSAVLEDDVQVAKEVGELQQLQELHIYVNSGEVSEEVLRAFALSLSKLYSLQRLNLIIESTCGNASNNDTLEGFHYLFSRPQFLRYLRIAVGFNELPDWIGSLKFLVEFVISETNLIGDQLFDSLCKLPKLKSIWMQRKSYRDDELIARSRHTFPVLINLKVTCSYDENLKVVLFEQGSMKELETLEVSFARRGRRVDGIEHLTNLKEVKLTGSRGNDSLNLAKMKVRGAPSPVGSK